MYKNIARYKAAYHSSAANYDNTAHLVTSDSDMPWISAGNAEEWIYIDLMSIADIKYISIHWGVTYAIAYQVQISNDANEWSTVAVHEKALGEVIITTMNCEAKYVRILCTACSGNEYIIHKVEVFGICTYENEINVSGDNWKICRAAEVGVSGEEISRSSYDDSLWLPATVPATALVSYLNQGAIPDPNYDDWQFQISEAYFTADFLYRNHFLIPAIQTGQRVFLCFESINWKADVYFNGSFLENTFPHRQHSIEGAFIRAKFDVTELVKYKKENALAVLIYKNVTPGKVTTQGLAYGPGPNGGLLGADNPTIHASVGWDWLPTIRGRNIGIYGDVSIKICGAAQLVDPWIETRLHMLEDSMRDNYEDKTLLAKNLINLPDVEINGEKSPFTDWSGCEGEGFTVDFGKSMILGSATFIWGSETGGAAADIESRHPEIFLLEGSVDGSSWISFDAFPGGEIDVKWFEKLNAEPNTGNGYIKGHATADTIQGGTAIVPLDLTFLDRGIVDTPIFAPQSYRYLRFTVIKQRELNGRKVDTRVRELRVYSESPTEVEQSAEHHFTLDPSRAELIFRTEVKHYGEDNAELALSGMITPGNIEFFHVFTATPGETISIEIPISIDNPRLWWPNTYGEQFLYTASVALQINDETSDEKTFNFGVRRFDYPIDGGMMTLYCNGVRIVAKGGNWGLDDGLKRDNAEKLDDKVRLHRDANMTMIRNWVGMTNHRGFYDACDKYGLLIWDDFWLANPVDGPEPNDIDLFLENGADKVRRVRSHPSLAMYCGRNESTPGDEINAVLLDITSRLDGTRLYFPDSASLPVGSGGGYSLAMPGGDGGIKQYFDDVSSSVLRSERGIPNVPTKESLEKFLKPENLWPINEVWALHDWTYHMNGPANTYMYALQNYLGGDFEIPQDNVQGQSPSDDDPVYQKYKADIAIMCKNAGDVWSFEEFMNAAQMINYDNHRGLFDALAARRTGGLLMWMSQSSWPSLMWQTYDWFLDCNGGYYGVKAGCQPTRVVFDPRDNSIMLANSTPYSYDDVVTTIVLYDINGNMVLNKDIATAHLMPDAYGVVIDKMDFSSSDSDIVFLRIVLKTANGDILGENIYWHNSAAYQDYRALAHMQRANVKLSAISETISDNGNFIFVLEISNGHTPALGVRVRLSSHNCCDVLPVFYSDNYLMLMPYESKIITAEFNPDRLIGPPIWSLSGWNCDYC